MREYVTHRHTCSRCEKAQVSCRSIPIREEDGAYCPAEARPEEIVCEDCLDLDSCAYCGLWSPAAELKVWESDLFCERCYEVVKREDSLREWSWGWRE